jgi:hypothetical protein
MSDTTLADLAKYRAMARRALVAFRGPGVIDADTITDLMADLLHYAQYHGLDVDCVLEAAQRHYHTEARP